MEYIPAQFLLDESYPVLIYFTKLLSLNDLNMKD